MAPTRMIFDVVVVGAGVMGASTARALAARGKRVALLEQLHVGHKRGSSHGASRIFRLSYPFARYVRMAQEALPLWRRLERDAGADLLTTTGGFDAGVGIDVNRDALESCGVRFEMLTGAEAGRRWSAVSFPTDTPVLYQPDAGIARADDTVRALIRLAVRDGVHLAEHSRVLRLAVGDQTVEAICEGDTYVAERLVVTAGAWSRGLLATAGVTLETRPTRETVAYFDVPQALFPVIVEWGEPAVYALPAPGHGLKAGRHIAGPVIDPDADGPPDERSVALLTRWVSERYPGGGPVAHKVETCLYTNTPDQHFVLERHGRVVVGSPCSGHGFKFAPLIGERLADLAVG